MIGMIKKDLYMIKNNYKSILIALAIYIFYSIEFDMDMSFFLPFMGLMICISTISYDDYNNWHTYATSLPQGKINVIKSKYITTIGITVLLTIISILLSFIIGSVKGTLNIDESLATIMGELFAIIFMLSLIFPILFKYGSEKGRIAMIIIGLGMFGLIILISKLVKVEISNDLINFLESYFIIIFIIVSIIMITISYYVSRKVYLKREF